MRRFPREQNTVMTSGPADKIRMFKNERVEISILFILFSPSQKTLLYEKILNTY